MKRDKSPHKKGDISEAMALAAFVAKDHVVCVPHGNNARYDLVVEMNGALQRVQVKTGRLNKTKTIINFNVVSSHWNYGATVRRVGDRRYDGQIDYFAVYAPEVGKVYLIPILLMADRWKGSIRLKKAQGSKFSHMALDGTSFEFFDFMVAQAGVDPA